MFSLKDKVAIITGGGSGIGKSIAELFAARGATVFVLDIAIATVDRTAKEENIFFEKCNISVKGEVDTLISSIYGRVGRLDIVVNNAGIAHVGNAESTRPDDFDRLFSVNVKGVYHVLQASIPYMKEKGGVILNMASTAAWVGLPDRFAYSMTKGAVMAMTLSVARDYLRYNIRCNSISPARIHTPFVDGFIQKNYPGKEQEMFERLSRTQPVGRMGKPAEIASLALYLCSEEAAFVTGNDYPADGGVIKLNT
jgi:NAD(P)-dependent dehydrogenase (short-subunit alcohol dehydrogenase family)